MNADYEEKIELEGKIASGNIRIDLKKKEIEIEITKKTTIARKSVGKQTERNLADI